MQAEVYMSGLFASLYGFRYPYCLENDGSSFLLTFYRVQVHKSVKFPSDSLLFLSS